ncbi:RluA family pseudouridine synthase [Candidatus Dependentiae bacterium]|nr:RluA family pseudouridine synthase [Candidatus Dependentiae bacterium]
MERTPEPSVSVQSTVDPTSSPLRIDLYLVQQFPGYSRNFFQKLLETGSIQVNEKPILKSNSVVKAHDRVAITFPVPQALEGLALPQEDLGVKVLYEHPDFLIVYKPAGLMVHTPHEYSTTVTLVDWLIHHFKELKGVGPSDRPGIVHRLDKDTSGILVIPRNEQTLTYFGNLFRKRTIEKTYRAVVVGHPFNTGTIEFPISRHPQQNHKMTHQHPRGRESLTYYTVLEYFKDAALVEVKPLTGRTHQIRVHFSALGYPVLGDTVYGTASDTIKRQALHAYSLSFTYKDKLFSFVYGVPQDMLQLLDSLRKQTI